MLGNEAQAASIKNILGAISCANTAAASPATYVDVRRFEGDVELIITPGAITGSCTPTINDATDTSGTSAASITPNEGAPVALTANTPVKYTFRAQSTRGFIGFVGTIVTGPAVLAVALQGRPKNF